MKGDRTAAARRGWYPDPFDSPAYRYWDGWRWTFRAAAADAILEPRRRHWRRFLWIAYAVLLTPLSLASFVPEIQAIGWLGVLDLFVSVPGLLALFAHIGNRRLLSASFWKPYAYFIVAWNVIGAIAVVPHLTGQRFGLADAAGALFYVPLYVAVINYAYRRWPPRVAAGTAAAIPAAAPPVAPAAPPPAAAAAAAPPAAALPLPAAIPPLPPPEWPAVLPYRMVLPAPRADTMLVIPCAGRVSRVLVALPGLVGPALIALSSSATLGAALTDGSSSGAAYVPAPEHTQVLFACLGLAMATALALALCGVALPRRPHTSRSVAAVLLPLIPLGVTLALTLRGMAVAFNGLVAASLAFMAGLAVVRLCRPPDVPAGGTAARALAPSHGRLWGWLTLPALVAPALITAGGLISVTTWWVYWAGLPAGPDGYLYALGYGVLAGPARWLSLVIVALGFVLALALVVAAAPWRFAGWGGRGAGPRRVLVSARPAPAQGAGARRRGSAGRGAVVRPARGWRAPLRARVGLGRLRGDGRPLFECHRDLDPAPDAERFLVNRQLARIEVLLDLGIADPDVGLELVGGVHPDRTARRASDIRRRNDQHRRQGVRHHQSPRGTADLGPPEQLWMLGLLQRELVAGQRHHVEIIPRHARDRLGVGIEAGAST